MKFALFTAIFSVSALTANAQDIDRGRTAFSECLTCHSVIDSSGQKLASGAKVGPNLYGVAGRRAGAVSGFNYSTSLKKAGEGGLVWTAGAFEEYLKNPTKFLKKWLKDDSARGRMAYRRKQDAKDIYAYLRSLK